MLRTALGAVLIVAVVVGGFIYGAINTITNEDWPDYDI